MFASFREYFQGKKTYTVAGFGVVLFLLNYFFQISPDMVVAQVSELSGDASEAAGDFGGKVDGFKTALGVTAMSLMATLRAALGKAQETQEELKAQLEELKRKL